MSQAGQKSKFRSCFGEPAPLTPKKAYVSQGSSRKKVVSYFDTVKRMSLNESQNQLDHSSTHLQSEQVNQPMGAQETYQTDELLAVHQEPEQENRQISDLQEEMEGEDDREPKLYVDVNVANFGLQRIIVYEGDTVESLVSDFVKRCPIDEFMIEKLKTLLQQQIDGVLERIDEDEDLSDLEEIDDSKRSPDANA